MIWKRVKSIGGDYYYHETPLITLFINKSENKWCLTNSENKNKEYFFTLESAKYAAKQLIIKKLSAKIEQINKYCKTNKITL